MASYLVVIYGPPGAGKTALAYALARLLPGKSAVVSVDHLLREAIAVPSPDAAAEFDMVHTQVRLLVANYMKSGYHVVVEGPFYYEREGTLHRYEQDIDQLVSLMRQMTRRALTVRLKRGRDATEAQPADAGLADRIDATYKPRYGASSLTFESGAMSMEEVARAIRERLAE